MSGFCRLAGGGNGQMDWDWARRNDGGMQRLEGADATILEAGEAVIIQTPTAGGYGPLHERSTDR